MLSRSGPTLCQAWSWSKLFAKVISRQKTPVLGKELRVDKRVPTPEYSGIAVTVVDWTTSVTGGMGGKVSFVMLVRGSVDNQDLRTTENLCQYSEKRSWRISLIMQKTHTVKPMTPNTNGSFTVAHSNSFLSHWKFLLTAQENKYLGVF